MPMPEQKNRLQLNCEDLEGPHLHISRSSRETTVHFAILKATSLQISAKPSYHYMGDDMVERMNRTLLNLPCSYIHTTRDWDQLLPYTHHKTKLSSTGLSPHQVLFGYNPPYSKHECTHKQLNLIVIMNKFNRMEGSSKQPY